MRRRALSGTLIAALAVGCDDPQPAPERLEAGLTPTVSLLGSEELVFTSAAGCPAGTAPPGEIAVDLPDGPARAFRDGGTVQLISSSHPSFRLAGTSLDDLRRDCAVPALGSHYNADPNAYDDAEWLWSTWAAGGGVVVALVHNEYHGHVHAAANPALCPSRDYGSCWYNSISLAVSTDGGRTYAHAPAPAHVVARGSGYVPDGGAAGYFEPTNIIHRDGWFYVLSRVVKPTPGSCVLRTADLGDPASWRAWDGAGWNARPALGEPCAPVIASSAHAVGNVTWNSYFGQYVAVMMIDEGGRQGFAMRTSSDLVTWSAPTFLMDAPMPWGTYPASLTSYAYPALIDPADPSANFETTGQTPYLYYVRTINVLDRKLVRVPIRFELGDGPSPLHWPPNLFRVGDGIYYSNGSRRCAFPFMDQYARCTGTRDVSQVAAWPSVPPLPDDGLCACGDGEPVGLFRLPVGAAGFANGAGHYCLFGSPESLATCGGVTDFWSLPEYLSTGALAYDGACGCPAMPPPPGDPPPGDPPPAPGADPTGLFRIGGGGYFANGAGHYCSFPNMERWNQCAGIDFWAAPEVPSAGTLVYDGECCCAAAQAALPAGFFRSGGGAFYSNGACRFCGIGSPAQLAGCTGGADFFSLTERPAAGASYDGVCGCGS